MLQMPDDYQGVDNQNILSNQFEKNNHENNHV